MGVSLTIDQKLTATEELASADFPTLSASNVSGNSVVHSAFNRSNKVLNGSSTPPVDAVGGGELTIASSAGAIDFTAFPTVLDATADMTGKKVVAFLLRAPTDNSAAITVSPGASNGYDLNGGDDLVVPPGGCIVVAFADVVSPLPTVSGTEKALDLAGTDDDALQYEFVFGTPAS